tara:strand:+ start:12768 stop:13076 length:309 start_codon:yes stop_codon:yes gene_type:complete
MIVVNPNELSHTIKIIPRYESDNSLNLSIKDNFRDITTDMTPTYSYFEGVLSLTFDYTFSDEGRYQVSLTDTVSNEVVYRGAFISTTQDTQDYKLTEDKFYF